MPTSATMAGRGLGVKVRSAEEHELEKEVLALSLSPTLPSPMKGVEEVIKPRSDHSKPKGPPRANLESKLIDEVTAPYQALPVSGLLVETLATEQPVLTFGSDEERKKAVKDVIDKYRSMLLDRTKTHMGYPYNLDFDYGPLETLLRFSINNLGDPFIESNYGVHSRQFEVGVLHWFAKLWEIEQDDFWGYVTNCGTEGNLHGLLVGRETLPDGILYSSSESHYSVFKAANMYRMQAVKVPTLQTGEINYTLLQAALEENKDKPAIVNVNIGTTVKGAIDDLDEVLRILNEVGYTEDRFYIHCDGALFGMMIPFITEASMVSFRKPIGSVSVSGHKFIGCPTPCGVVMTRMRHVQALSNDVEYLNSRDATIMGSRNGHAPIYMWYTLTMKGYEGFKADVKQCLRNAHYLHSLLFEAGIRTMLNASSSTVVFSRPKSHLFVRKWQLACQGDIAHVVVMPNITQEKIKAFVDELVSTEAEAEKVA